MEKTYYELRLKALSPLRIGGGSAENTDTDILVDGRGIPFIPGSSLAGVLREMLPDEDIRKELFGDVEIAADAGNKPGARASLILVSDAELADEKKEDSKKIKETEDENSFLISVRDGIGLDEWGMVIRGAKYDFETAEVRGDFRAVLECNFEEPGQQAAMEQVLASAVSGGLHLGARTSRGYGRMTCTVRKRTFRFPEDTAAWLQFRPFADDAFKEGTEIVQPAPETNSDRTIIRLIFTLEGNLSIRVREANAEAREDGTNPDDVTIKNQNGNPVIPGTAWAGSFRHHMQDINRELAGEKLPETRIDRLFGKGQKGDDSTKSRLWFSESVIEGGEPVINTRNAVDRFTAAPTNGTLFTNEEWHGGQGELLIRYKTGDLSDSEKSLLAAAVMDLSLGMMTVGGGAATGRGIIKVQSVTVNGAEKTADIENFSFALQEE